MRTRSGSVPFLKRGFMQRPKTATTLFQGLGLYKLYRDDDVRTARYDRYWVRENVLHLKSNQPLADDCEELVVRNDSKEVARNVVVHTHDLFILLDLDPA